MDSLRKDHKETEMESFNDDILYGDGGEKGSTIQIGHNLVFGLGLDFGIFPDVQGQQPIRESSAAFVGFPESISPPEHLLTKVQLL
jgi:hypothetical protein